MINYKTLFDDCQKFGVRKIILDPEGNVLQVNFGRDISEPAEQQTAPTEAELRAEAEKILFLATEG